MAQRHDAFMYYIDIETTTTLYFRKSYSMSYTLQPDNSVICQCGAFINKYYMQKHLQTAKHERDMVGRENIEVLIL